MFFYASGIHTIHIYIRRLMFVKIDICFCSIAVYLIQDVALVHKVLFIFLSLTSLMF